MKQKPNYKTTLMKRRTFIEKSSLIAVSISAFGSIQWNGKSYTGDSATTTDILGPFYRPDAPLRSNIIPPHSKGVPLNLNGTIYKEDGKTPLQNALIEIWQCDEDQHYDNTSDDYLFRGAMKTSEDGMYEFKTIVPVPYKVNPDNENSSWRPAHIHMRVSVPNQQDLITQIYFKGDKYIEKDMTASSPQAISRILSISKDPDDNNTVTFDVVLNKEIPLENEVYNKITGIYRMDNDYLIEFYRNDDMLFMKRNGQVVAGLNYLGNNTFKGGIGYPKVKFELLEKGGSKAIVEFPKNKITGVKFLKYG
jgi:protocatechuate 3,4-dioxygenase beta subunit